MGKLGRVTAGLAGLALSLANAFAPVAYAGPSGLVPVRMDNLTATTPASLENQSGTGLEKCYSGLAAWGEAMRAKGYESRIYVTLLRTDHGLPVMLTISSNPATHKGVAHIVSNLTPETLQLLHDKRIRVDQISPTPVACESHALSRVHTYTISNSDINIDGSTESDNRFLQYLRDADKSGDQVLLTGFITGDPADKKISEHGNPFALMSLKGTRQPYIVEYTARDRRMAPLFITACDLSLKDEPEDALLVSGCAVGSEIKRVVPEVSALKP